MSYICTVVCLTWPNVFQRLFLTHLFFAGVNRVFKGSFVIASSVKYSVRTCNKMKKYLNFWSLFYVKKWKKGRNIFSVKKLSPRKMSGSENPQMVYGRGGEGEIDMQVLNRANMKHQGAWG